MQHQFLHVIHRDEAEQKFRAALSLAPCGSEEVTLDKALGRVLAQDVLATVDVPSFDRSNYDGFAVQARDTFGASEEDPRELILLARSIATADVPTADVTSQAAVAIATGGMLPRGADAVVMVEHTDTMEANDQQRGRLLVRRAVHAGYGVTFAGTDIAAGETVLRQGDLLTSRETGVLAAIGVAEVPVVRRPTVAIISTGDEIIAPGQPMSPGKVYDSNARILADAVRELGGEPYIMGIVHDDRRALRAKLDQALGSVDAVLLSGGTSKGQGDLCYHIVGEATDPGIVAHGVALKPGKPICLAAHEGKPVVILPGFPTSAIFTFHEFVAPVLRLLAGRLSQQTASVTATLPVPINSEIGRTEYLLVGLVERPDSTANAAKYSAFPMGKGSGSVTTFSRADGFVTIDRHTEILPAGTEIDVTLLGRDVQAADLVVIGSQCVGLDYLLGQMQQQGWRSKFLAVGSTAGLEAARRGECDFAGIHLLDASTNQYNTPFLHEGVELIRGYRRRQGLLFRAGDKRFTNGTPHEAIAQVRGDPDCMMINRNQGSGTRILIDKLLAESEGAEQPRGYAVQAKNHNAVAAAIRQGRADWGVAIETVASSVDAATSKKSLCFTPIGDEYFDFAVPTSRRNRPAVVAFAEMLQNADVRHSLEQLGFSFASGGP